MNKQISTWAGIAIVAGMGLTVATIMWFAQEPQTQVQPVQSLAGKTPAAASQTATQNQSTAQQSSPQQSDSLETVKSFYNWYVQNTSDMSEKYITHKITASQYDTLGKQFNEEVKKRPEMTSQAYKKIQARASGGDPFVCSNGVPNIAYFNHQPVVKGSTATVVVESGWKNSDPNDTTYTAPNNVFTVKLVLENGTWKIDDVVCKI